MSQGTKVDVLVVGKEANHLSELIHELELFGCAVIRATGLAKWVAPLIQTTGFRVIFFDVESEKGSYAELIDALKGEGKHQPSTKVIVTCRHCRMADYLEAMQVGAYDFICPPFDRADLTRILRNVYLCPQVNAEKLGPAVAQGQSDAAATGAPALLSEMRSPLVRSGDAH